MDSIINFIINCILSIIDLYLINFYILNYNHKADENTKYFKLNLSNTMCLTILTLSNSLSTSFIISIFITIILFVLQLIFNHLSFLNNLKSIFYFLILKVIIHFTCHLIFTWIFDAQIVNYYLNFLFSYILLVLLIERYVIFMIISLYYNNLSNRKFYYFKILSITLFAYFCSVIIFNTSSLFYFPVVGRTFIFVMFVSIASSIFFDRYQVKHEKIEKDLAIQTQNILKEKEYIYKRISVDEKERKMRHDVRNNLDIVYGYLRDKKYEKAEDLVKELLGVVEERDALIHTGNVSIDSVIDDKLSLAKERNIIYEENAKNMYYGDIEINELALLIGLALDNAIEACEKVEENRYIYFEARNKKDYLVIHITNSIIPHTKPRFYKTSKLVDKMNHGFGVEEIKDIVKRYDGDIQYDTKEDRVILRIILKTKKD